MKKHEKILLELKRRHQNILELGDLQGWSDYTVGIRETLSSLIVFVENFGTLGERFERYPEPPPPPSSRILPESGPIKPPKK